MRSSRWDPLPGGVAGGHAADICGRTAGEWGGAGAGPVGRAYYSFSTLLCTPASLSQEVGLALGAQAGEARIADVVGMAGFTRFRRAAETPFNIVFEARP